MLCLGLAAGCVCAAAFKQIGVRLNFYRYDVIEQKLVKHKGFTECNTLLLLPLHSHFQISLVELNSRDITLDTALVIATGNLEETAVTPLLVPAVLDDPVITAVGIGTPSDHQDSVTSEKRTCRVLVYTALVRRKVRVHTEGHSKRSVLHDCSLHFRYRAKRERVRSFRFVIRVAVIRVRRFTLSLA